MRYRKLGRTDIDVSLICLGTMTWGETNTETDAHEQLDYGIDHGVNFIDTAEAYAVPINPTTQGSTERIIGNWLKSKDRSQIILASKVAGPGDWIKHIRGGPRLNREHIIKALEDSLSRLQTDVIDLYQVHWPERKTNFFGKLGYSSVPAEQAEEKNIPIAETLEVLNNLVTAGKIRQIGISNETSWGAMRYLQLAEENDWPRVVTVQNPYNLLNRSFEVGLAEIAHREDLGLLAYSPLAFGMLSGKYVEKTDKKTDRLNVYSDYYTRYSNPQGIAATESYVDLARSNGISPTQLAHGWINSRPFVTANIIGATNIQQLKENIESVDVILDKETLQGIDDIHQKYTNPCP